MIMSKVESLLEEEVACIVHIVVDVVSKYELGYTNESHVPYL